MNSGSFLVVISIAVMADMMWAAVVLAVVWALTFVVNLNG